MVAKEEEATAGSREEKEGKEEKGGRGWRVVKGRESWKRMSGEGRREVEKDEEW